LPAILLFKKALGIRKVSLQEAKWWKEKLSKILATLLRLL
jgi:hypothetical protein